MKKIISITFQIFLLIILLCTVFTFVTSKTSFFGSIRSMVVLSGSMTPTFPAGSVVYIKPQLAYAVGDVITFKNASDQNVTHRVTDFTFSESGTIYKTKGDANNTSDNILVPSAKVKGKVFFSIPFIGKIIALFNTPVGFLAFIIVPTMILIGIELWNIKREIENQAEKRIIEKLQSHERRFFITS